ncbi:putative reverse transcriptase domain-containing protein [Tanacetum coccineum]
MPPRRVKKKSVKRLVEKYVAKAIEEYEKTRTNLDNAGSSGGNTGNAGGTMNVQGCLHKTFMNGKPHSFNETEGVVGLRHWIEEVEQVFEIWKCAEEDKVIFAASTFEGLDDDYCPATKIQRMEQELWTLTLKGDDIEAYNNHFHEMALMCPDLVPNEKKKIERCIRGFPERINGNITSSKPTLFMMQSTWPMNWSSKQFRVGLQELVKSIKGSGKTTKEPTTTITPTTTTTTTTTNVMFPGCGKKGHYRNRCPLGRNQPNKGARRRVYVVVENLQKNPNVITGTFLLNDHYASILFDSGAERSFVSPEFTQFINIASAALNTSFEVELADGKIVSTNTVLCGCTLALFSHVFKIDLIPTRLGSVDVIVWMDWLSYHRDVIVCYEKIVHIPLLNGEILKIQGERPKKDSRSHSCIKADEKKLDDVCIVCDFPEVFPDDLSGLPPVRKIEFHVDLIPGALLVVKSPYRLAPLEMLELSNQLKELQEKGFIRPSHSPWGAPMLFVKKKDGALRMRID